ncbi:MAG TPA: GNAT family protein [Rubrobacter sp.]|nr:GNAT family protein [Rubrobacter sp.]
MFYAGPDYSLEGLRIGPPAVELPREGVAAEYSRCFDEVQEGDDICYFSVYSGKALFGQILVHEENAGESLVGYHIFEPDLRGQGLGTKTLTLLKRFVAEKTKLSRLVIITSRDNLASRRLARKCGFVHIGASREDPENEMVFEWMVLRYHTDGN